MKNNTRSLKRIELMKRMTAMNKVGMVLALFSMGTGLWAQSASISPSRFYFKQAAGENGVQLLRVTNNGSRPATFQVAFSNFASEGNQEIGRASCRERV